MITGKNQKTISSAGVNIGRHEFGCRICAHPQREDIERDFVCWKSPAKIAKEYDLRDRSSVTRHAHALNLFPKRERNVRAALERIIEKVDDVTVNAAAVIQAISTYARINSQGQLVERNQGIDLNDLFDRMNQNELEAYAKDGSLPSWFTRALAATRKHGPGEGANG